MGGGDAAAASAAEETSLLLDDDGAIANVHRRAASEPKTREADEADGEGGRAKGGKARGGGGAGKISDRERFRRRTISIALTIFYGCLLVEGLFHALYKEKHYTFGPGVELEARRRQHCSVDTQIDLHLSSAREGVPAAAAGDTTAPSPGEASVRAALVLLVRGHANISGYSETRRWLRHVVDHLPWILKYDIIFFHEGDVTEEHQRYLRTGRLPVAAGRKGENQRVAQDSTERELHVPIEFVDLSTNSTEAFRVPQWIPKFYKAWPKRMGYLHMCRFYSVLLFPMLWDRYDYVFRLDDDVFLGQKVHTDLFELMEAQGLLYMYGSEVPEWNKTTKRTFGPWLWYNLLFERRNGMEGYNFTRTFTSSEIWSGKIGKDMYFTNFFLSRLDWWKQAQVQHLLNAIDQSGNIYYNRWGDAPIHTLALNLFADVCKVVPLCSISYYHSSTGHLISECQARNEDRPELYIAGLLDDDMR